ncbi:unnamed protein product [Pedinophyceae sp. YPF-701]|nr:unnamed protein product [Pedinophyceae sp. YPF-701]
MERPRSSVTRNGSKALSRGSVGIPGSAAGMVDAENFRSHKFAELVAQWVDSRNKQSMNETGGLPEDVHLLEELNITSARPMTAVEPRTADLRYGRDKEVRPVTVGGRRRQMSSRELLDKLQGDAAAPRAPATVNAWVRPPSSRPSTRSGGAASRPESASKHSAGADRPAAPEGEGKGEVEVEGAVEDAFRPPPPVSSTQPPNRKLTYMTTNQATYGLRDVPGDADVYEGMLQLTVQKESENKPWMTRSMWGDSLKKGDLSFWKRTCLRSSYQDFTENIIDPDTVEEVEAKENLHRYIGTSQTYFGDLLSKEKADDVARKFLAAPVEERDKMLDVMRNVHAAVQPHNPPYMSTTHRDYRVPGSFVDRELQELEKRETQYKVHGRPQTVELAKRRVPQRIRTASPEPAPAKMTRLQTVRSLAAGQTGKKKLAPETLKSHFQLTWGGNTGEPPESSYAEHFNKAPSTAVAAKRDKAENCDPWAFPTCPFGAVNRHTRATRDRDLYVPPYLVLGDTNKPRKGAGRTRASTTYDTSYKGGMAPRNDRRLAVQGAAALRTSSVPLGRKGICMTSGTGSTTYRAEYVKKLDPSDRARRIKQAQQLKEALASPSVPVGAVAPSLPPWWDDFKKSQAF